jgi:type I restriction enzyme M protein
VQIPAGHFWEDVRDTDEHLLGQALNDALAAIGRANRKQLSGVFERTDFNNKQALPTEDLKAVLDHFHDLGPLISERVSADMLGQAYEWLIAKFAATSGKAGGEFYTPAEVGKLCARLLDPEPNQSVYDPTCGSGGLLLQVLEYAKHKLGEDKARSLFLYGQELNPETWAIARMNMLLHGAGDAADIEREDTLKAPSFLDPDGGIRTFDLIVANPPFSPKNWGHERLKKAGDPYGRIKYLPPKSHGELAFVQHMVASMSNTGRVAVVLPNGVFFRGGPEELVRRELVDQDLVEAVIQLPKDLFYGAGIPACILLLNRAKHEERAGRILFIDGSECYERRDTKNVLRHTDVEQLASAFVSGNERPGVSAFASTKEVIERRYQLTVRRYVGGGGVDDQGLDLEEAIADYAAARAVRVAADSALQVVLRSYTDDEASQ